MKKGIIAAVLIVVVVLLAWLVWVQTKLLAITLGLLVVSAVALYFVLRRL